MKRGSTSSTKQLQAKHLITTSELSNMLIIAQCSYNSVNQNI